MKNKKFIVIFCILSVLFIILLILATGLNKGISDNKALVQQELKNKYNIIDFKIKTVRKSVYSNTIYKIVLNDGYEFDAYIDRECDTCTLLPFGKYETKVHDNYVEKYNAEVISNYLNRKQYKYTVNTKLLNSKIPEYNIDIEVDSSNLDVLLNDLKILDSLGNGLMKLNDLYTFSIINVKCGGKQATLRVGDPSDTYNYIYFKNQLTNLE